MHFLVFVLLANSGQIATQGVRTRRGVKEYPSQELQSGQSEVSSIWWRYDNDFLMEHDQLDQYIGKDDS